MKHCIKDISLITFHLSFLFFLHWYFTFEEKMNIQLLLKILFRSVIEILIGTRRQEHSRRTPNTQDEHRSTVDEHRVLKTNTDFSRRKQSSQNEHSAFSKNTGVFKNEHKSTLDEHKSTLDEHMSTLDEHMSTLDEHMSAQDK
jgi:hypothetical protein